MVPSNEYHYKGGAGAKLWGQRGRYNGVKRGKTESTRTKRESKVRGLPLVSLTGCRQLIEINVSSGWVEGKERSRLAVRELDA